MLTNKTHSVKPYLCNYMYQFYLVYFNLALNN